MKKEIGILIIILIVLVGVIAISTGTYYLGKSSNKNSDIKLSENTENNDTKNKEIICSKDVEIIDDNPFYSAVEAYVVTYDKTGEVVSYIQKYIETYTDKKEYDAIKTADIGEYKLAFDDSKLTVTRSYNILDKDNEESIWYKPIVKSLEEKGYACK